MNLESYFAELSALVPLVILISQFIVNKFKLSGTAAQVTSWVVAEALTFGGFFAGVGGFLTGIEQIWLVAVYGLAAGLVANGIFDVSIVKALLEFIKLRAPKEAQ